MSLALGSLVLLLACSSEAPAPAPVAEAPPPAALDPVAARSVAIDDVLAPSPEETRASVEKQGLTTRLGSLVPDRKFDTSVPNPDLVALRTGVLISDTVLAIQELDKAVLMQRISAIRTGLATMGAGQGLLDTVEGLRVAVESDAITRDGLLTEIDGLVGFATPEAGVGPKDRTGPLLQAGAWLSGVNLVAQAVLAEQNWSAADVLLRQEGVATWFLAFSREQGADRAGPEIAKALESALLALQETAAKPNLQQADVELVRDRTGALLTMI